MKLHAGSLYKNYLVLYGNPDDTAIIIQVDNKDLQWEIYCNDVDVKLKKKFAEVTFQHKDIRETHFFPYFISNNPMKDLGFSE